MDFSAEELRRAGGREWEKHGLHRFYFDDMPRSLGSLYYDMGKGNFFGKPLCPEDVEDFQSVFVAAVEEILGRIRYVT